MYSEFHDIELLKAAILKDKKAMGMDIYTHDRYPIRFILLDNFRDCSQLIDFVQSEIGAIVKSVDQWIDPDYPDLMITYTELARRIQEYVKQMQSADCVIAPFSELARFYDNKYTKTFDSLLKTIKGIEAGREALEHHQRVYIPIVGLEGKMETFIKDTQSTIWRLHAANKELTYRLILTNQETFGVKGLDQHYTVVTNIREWLNVWKDADKQVTPNIISTSRCIYANATYAQPDNAFSFEICDNAYQFLTQGLQLPLGGMEQSALDGENWDTLASQIDLTSGFCFSDYVLSYFMVNAIDDTISFMRIWLENPSQFDRWLLMRYYQINKEGQGYLCNLLSKMTMLTGNDLIEQVALSMNENEANMLERRNCLRLAAEHHIVLREGAQITLVSRLENIAKKYTAASALKYISGITNKEKDLVIVWLSKGQIRLEQVKDIYPDLYYYLKEGLGISVGIPEWIPNYLSAYKQAKLTNSYEDSIVSQLIAVHNESEVTFDGWYQDFSTTRTLLNGRGDIEKYYWIDGLGVEWIPLIKQIVNEKKDQGLYLNEVKVARALLPTVTSVNKEDLQKLLPEGSHLEKSGDLDSMAHQNTNVWPSYINNEIERVRNIIEDILSKYVGKKIAIISDHGLTHLSQLCDGLGMTGVSSDHHGRIAEQKNKSWTADHNYIRLGNGKSICALRHRSLCNKVPKGQGVHGGCTPEEVLVPIFVISSFPTDAAWTADLLTLEISGTDPRLRFMIKNIPTYEIPVIEFGNKRYNLYQEGKDTFISESLSLTEDIKHVELIIGSVSRIYPISIDMGVKEDDLFGGF